MLSLKTLRPTKKEKKRYVVYQMEFLEDAEVKTLQDKFISKLKENLGIFGSAKAGIIPVSFDKKTMKGIIRVNHKMVDEIRANFTFISKIGNQKVVLRTLGVSGILKKAKLFLDK